MTQLRRLPRGCTRRRGMAIYVVMGVMATLAVILLFFFSSMRMRGQEVHLTSDREIGRWMARGSLECVRYAMAAQLEQPRHSGEDLRGGPLSDVLLNDPAGLTGLLQSNKSSVRDDRDFLDQLIGHKALAPLDAWVSGHPHSALSYHINTISSSPLSPTTGGLVDPVLKVSQMDISVDCHLGHALETYEGQTSLLVTTVLPYVTSRFTLTAVDVGGPVQDAIQVNAQGGVVGGPAPVMLFHAPEDLADADDPLSNPTGVVTGLVKQGSVGSMTDAQTALGKRGAVYLSGTQADVPVVLRLAAGGAPLGQYYQIYAPTGGKTTLPAARKVEHQPPNLESFHPTEPGTDTRQAAFIQGAVFGYYLGIDRDQLLGPPSQGETPGEGTSVLRIMGTAAHPSPCLVYGPVDTGLAAISDLAVDRDMTSKDEEDQKDFVGHDLPIRESIDPFLRSVSQAAFTSDVAGESAGGGTYTYLLPFQSQGLSPGMVNNLNAVADTGTGMPVAVPSEIPHNPLRLDLTQYRYGTIFKSYDEYTHAMSHRIAIPANAMLELASMDPDGAALQLERTAQGGSNAPPYIDETLTKARFLHTDPVHQMIAASAGTQAYIDTLAPQSASLDDTVRYWKDRADQVVATPLGAQAFKSMYVRGNELDLEGLHVCVQPANMTAKAPQLDLGSVTVVPSGGGVLEVDTLKLSGVKNLGMGPDFAPLVIKAKTLILDGKGPFEAVFVLASAPQLTGTSTYALIRGALVAGAGTIDTLARPLAVVYDPRLDPTAVDADVHYRARIIPPQGMPWYRAPERWESHL